MSNWNQLETNLRSWTPRRPSRRLEARLFARKGSAGEATLAAGEERAEQPFSWHWFAPSTVLVLLATFLLGHHSSVLGLSPSASPGLFASAALLQPDLSTYYVSARHSENNTPVIGVEWTNGSIALSGTPTNGMLH